MDVDPFQGKSPKMWLNEISVKQLAQVKYETSEKIPAEVPPRFICRCTYKYKDRTLEVEAAGKTKKEAEQEAAKEILIHKLSLTPAQFKGLNEASKKSAPSPQAITEVDTEAVSDTDDQELNSGANPIGELLAISATEFNAEPIYVDVRTEGPPHKRIFTVECSLVVPRRGIDLSFIGRRPQKKMAKKLAALRVLREVNKLGFRYQQFEARNNNSCSDATVSSTTYGTEELDGANNGREESDSSGGQRIVYQPVEDELGKLSLSESDQEKLKSVITGKRKYCDDDDGTQSCVKFCSDFTHVFRHTKKSETLENLLIAKDFNKAVEDLGGASSALKKITREMGVKITWIFGKNDENCPSVGFLQLNFNFDVTQTLPKTIVLSGVGVTKDLTKQLVAAEAVNFFKLMYS